MQKFLVIIGKLLFTLRSVMSLFYVGLVAVMFVILYKFLGEVYYLIFPATDVPLAKMDLIIKVLELVDITMVAQLVWVVALAGFSLFITSEHFDKSDVQKPDWLDHVNTYNLKLKLAFAIISISGVHALKTYLKGGMLPYDILITALIHFFFVLSAVGIAYAEYITKKKSDH